MVDGLTEGPGDGDTVGLGEFRIDGEDVGILAGLIVGYRLGLQDGP